jgi:hypothetical protein
MTDSVIAPRVAIARAIIRQGDDALDEAGRRLIDAGRDLTLQDQVMIAFAHKILRTFEALVDDAERGRTEAMHHLKTLCESYIYFREALKDEDSAALVPGTSLFRRTEYRRYNPELADAEHLSQVEEAARELCGGKTLPDLWKIAKQHGDELRQWYNVVYRFACEPAHIGDLITFLPGDATGIRGLAQSSTHEAATALPWGTDIVLLNLV